MANSDKIGILAYGSILTFPGEEIEPLIIRRFFVKTPFEVEYARCSHGRNGAPTIVPVPDGMGRSANAEVLVLKDDVSLNDARDILYRRETNRINASNIFYDNDRQKASKDGLIVEELEDFFGITVVVYAGLKPNNSDILSGELSDMEKSQILAKLAIDSLNRDTFDSGRDGIQYLYDNIQKKIVTRLTKKYMQNILQTTGAKDLPGARRTLIKMLR